MKGLYFAKAWFTKRLTIFIKLATLRNLSPDLFTGIGIAGAVLASRALVLTEHHPIFGCVLVGLGLVIRLGGANLDGAVARAQGRSHAFGFVINEIGDRVSDFIIMAGVVTIAWHTQVSNVRILSVVAIVAATLPTLISLAGAGAGGVRINGGPFGKTERCATIFLLSVAIAIGFSISASITIACDAIILGSIITAIARVQAYRKAFANTGSK
jgi:CDP-diacylglycerol--glycerol-3-phosphate 3-phosphatidyltransferase